MFAKYMRSVSFAALALCCLGSAQAAEKLIADRVFYVHDPKAANIQFRLMIRAGCADEAGSQCKGLAHYLEHLVLTGRNAENKETAMRFFADGSSNGSTSDRRTTFDHSFPANAADAPERLERLFDFYAARFRGFDVTPEIAERERKVVMQERNWRLTHNAFIPAWRQAMQFLYQGHPLGELVVGTPETIEQFNTDDARAFHNKWYRISNSYIVVSGPVDENVVKAIADKHLATLDRSPPSPREWLSQLPDLTPAKMVIASEDPRIDSLYVSYRKIGALEESNYARTTAAMRIINDFLGSKLRGSPHSELVEKSEIAATLTGASISHPQKGVFALEMSAEPASGVSHARMEEAMLKYLQRVAETGLDEALAARIRKRVLEAFERQVADPATAPARLFDWLDEEITYDELKAIPETIESITTAELNQILRALVTPGREAVINYAPKPVN